MCWAATRSSPTPDADVELEAPARVARVVQRHAAEHQRVRQPQVVAVERHQDRRARGHRDHDALVAVDDDVVAGRERLAQAHQDAGEVVLQRVLEGEAERDAEHAGGAEHGADKRGGVHDLQRHQQAERGDRPAHGGARQVAQEGVAPGHPLEQRAAREPAAEQPEQPHRDQRQRQQRQCGEQAVRLVQQALADEVEIERRSGHRDAV